MPQSRPGERQRHTSHIGGSWDDVTMDSDYDSSGHDTTDRATMRIKNRNSRRDSKAPHNTSSTPSTYPSIPTESSASGFVMPRLDHSESSSTTSSSKFGDGSSHQHRRRMGAANSSKASSSVRTTTRVPQSRRHTRPKGEDVTVFMWANVINPTLAYVFSTLKMTLDYAKPLVAFALLSYIVYALLLWARNGVSASVQNALAPVCAIPGASYIIPYCRTVRNATGRAEPLEFSHLVQAQASFEDVLMASADSATLPQDMKRSEASIRDLRHVVEYSSLPSRHELVLEFQGFIETARKASYDLTLYNSRIGRAVDRILSTNKWTLQVLEGIAETEASRGRLTRFVQDRLNPFAPFMASGPHPQTLLFDQYIKHTSAIEEQVSSLILEAQALLRILQNLDDRLDLIAGISRRDGVKIEGNQDVLLAQLWTKLGGNRNEAKKYKDQLSLLDDVGKYRKLAIAHVSRTVLKLQAISANLEDLRERVARPEVVGIRDDLPLEMHVREIIMGVERLEAVRDEGRRVEGDWVGGQLGKGDKLALEVA